MKGKKITKSVPGTLKGTLIWKFLVMGLFKKVGSLSIRVHAWIFGWSAKDAHVDSCWEGSGRKLTEKSTPGSRMENCTGTIEFFNGDESEFRGVRKRVARRNDSLA
jgi:hypothetical protein